MYFLSRFYIKLFMVSKAASGYICSFSIYSMKIPNDLLKDHVTLDLDCSRMTKPV